MPVSGADFGSVPPAGTALDLRNIWFDGAVQFRSGGSVQMNAGLNYPTQTTTPTTPTNGSVLYSANGGVLTSVSPTGQVTTIGGVTQAQTTTSTVANTASATALQSYTVPASDPVTGAVYVMYGYGLYSDTGTPTLTFTLFWGGVAGTTLASIPAITLGSGVTNVPFSYECMVTYRTATTAWSNITLNLGTSSATDLASTYVATPTAVTTVTSNVASALTLGVTWSAASASNTISLLGGVVERIA